MCSQGETTQHTTTDRETVVIDSNRRAGPFNINKSGVARAQTAEWRKRFQKFTIYNLRSAEKRGVLCAVLIKQLLRAAAEQLLDRFRVQARTLKQDAGTARTGAV